MAVSVSSELMTDRKLWAPVIAVECSVPWDVLSKADHYEHSDFFGPFPVLANEKETLFSIRFFRVGKRIAVYLEQPQPCYENEYKTRELMVKSCVLWTKQDGRKGSFNQNPLKWPLPEERNSTHFIPDKSKRYSDQRTEIFSELLLKIRCFTVKLEVYARRSNPGESLINDLNLARKSGSSLCDIQLCADGCDFPAHKAVLSASSSVFMAMFAGEWKGKNADRVIIEGVSKDSLGKFLDFLYTGVLTSWEGCELELLHLSELYQVERLKKRCEVRLWGLDGPRALGVLMEAHKWPVLTDDMKNRLYQCVAASLRSVMDTDNWKTLQSSSPTLSGIIQALASAVPASVKVFEALPRLEEDEEDRL